MLTTSAIHPRLIEDEVFLCERVNKVAQKEHAPFESEALKDGSTNFERVLAYNDITIIEIYDTKGNVYDFFVNWHEEDEGNNRYQSSLIGGNGNLYVTVSARYDVRSWFENRVDEKCWGWLRYDWGEKSE